MRLRTDPRSAFSMVEVIIAITIFTVLMAGLVEAMTSVKRYESASIIKDDLQSECDSAIRCITSDLATSGWYFYGQKDSNGDGVISATENVDGTGSVTVDFANAATDRRMRYYPYLRGETAATIATAFPTRVDVDRTVLPALRVNPLVDLSPWTTLRYPGWTQGQVPALAAALIVQAERQGLLIPSTSEAVPVAIAADAAVQMGQQQAVDLAVEMVQPSNEIIFLRGATGPWNADPTLSDNSVPDDLTFFPSYAQGAANTIVRPKGASAFDWRNPGDHWSSSTNPTGLPVLFPSSYEDDGSGAFIHRNAATNPNAAATMYGQPYGNKSWGAYLDDSSAGLVIRMQWEALSANRMFKDINPGVDDFPLPDDLREFTYAVIPSPFGFGRLVRAHTVLVGGTAPVLGVDIGNWITDTTAPRGYQIDKILSDNVVRAVWMTRRHDPRLGANQVRARFVFARAVRQAEGLHRSVVLRQVDQVFTMRANNSYDDQKTAATSIDIGTDNVPFTF